ncbi:MAG: response regulator [Hyphomicrobiales bacterium]|nr:response regulator [Hyphomicrobiales bacterium]MDE2373087.1 response regulator [Hyphomicrobiales bacterium]
MARLRSKRKSAAKLSRRRMKRRAPALSPRDADASLVAYAHDIRTALTGVLALGELLASSSLGERERQWALEIKDSAEHLASLTTLMIDAAKAGRGTFKLRREAFAPRRLIASLADSLTVRAQTKGLRAAVTVADDIPELVEGDPVRLRAAIENLIDNAVKFTANGSVQLAVQAERTARGLVRLVFTVTDTGIGLKTADIKRLFRPFVQANADIARRYGGSGLGLAVVKALAKRMGGDLTVTSAPRRGTSFRFAATLPIGRNAAAGDAAVPQHQFSARPLAILCAEDNPYGRVILNTILGELGHRADFVGSGEEAVAAVARGYDAVLMDITLAGIDGLEAARRIRALAGAAARTPIIGISGRAGPGDETAARTAGMNAYLRKPVSPSALRKAIGAVTDKR